MCRNTKAKPFRLVYLMKITMFILANIRDMGKLVYLLNGGVLV